MLCLVKVGRSSCFHLVFSHANVLFDQVTTLGLQLWQVLLLLLVDEGLLDGILPKLILDQQVNLVVSISNFQEGCL